MRILVMGLDCAAPEILFKHDGLKNIKTLMSQGCYGRLQSVIPPITVPAWMCMSTSQDPGSLGVYGFRNRIDHTYSGMGVVNSASIQAPAIWDTLAQHGLRSVVIGVPPSFPPARSMASTSAVFSRRILTQTHTLGRPVSNPRSRRWSESIPWM